ncbi:MAG: serine protease [Lachnospiraceae bacterium]|nr:serine protease [Lachnospiraceae bacterium]MBP3610441.1 serine protease [Lachnospiraceae bacterium]
MTTLEIIGILLLIAGFVLVGIEMMLPGFGLPGISGILCLVGGIILTADSVSNGIVMAIVVVVILGVMLAVVMTVLGSKRMKSPIVLREDVKGERGFLGVADLEYLVGREGMAVTDLRPSGKGNFDGIDFDILSDGAYVQKGTKIRITKVKDNKLIVIKVTE